MTNLVIATKVPVPPASIRVHFLKLKVGESIFFNSARAGTARLVASKLKSTDETFNYTTRSEGGGIRVWRTAR